MVCRPRWARKRPTKWGPLRTELLRLEQTDRARFGFARGSFLTNLLASVCLSHVGPSSHQHCSIITFLSGLALPILSPAGMVLATDLFRKRVDSAEFESLITSEGRYVCYPTDG